MAARPGTASAAEAAPSPARRSARRKSAAADDPLEKYRGKRDFEATSEPKGASALGAGGRFVVQKHDARRLHYDLRLEMDGVLKSWAVTRGPSLVPGEKRLAVHTEDHPVEYLTFEGVIPAGEYGGGTMIVWDRGTWTPEEDPEKGHAKGHLDFTLEGERLHGRWHLVRMRPRPREKTEQWLLIKAGDEHAREAGDPEIVDEETTSVLTGRTNADLAAGGEVREDHRAREEKTAKRKRAPAAPKGGRKGLLPVFVEPCLATLQAKPPTGDDWLHEIKFDGYRMQARIDGTSVRMLTRRGHDWTEKFQAVADALGDLDAGSALVDGEVVVEDEAGVSSFSALQAELSAGRSDRMAYQMFDLLYLDGRDLRQAPLVERKLALAALLDDVPKGGPLRYSDHVEGEGEAMIRHACRLGLEGIISKKRDAPYRSGRGTTWLKAKCTSSQEFVIAGFVPSTTARKAVGSLVLGQYDGDRLVHVGRVGTGFSNDVAEALFKDLDAIRRDAPPFQDKLPTAAARGVRWTEPVRVAEVELRGWTGDGMLRHASFKGLRDDKAPEEAVLERAADNRAKAGATKTGRKTKLSDDDLHLTHPDRLFWPDIGVTKQGLADFYSEVADWVLPHLAGRPLALVRCPSGVGDSCFFQKHAWRGIGEAIGRHRVGDEEVLTIEDEAGLIALVQSGVLEIHPWGASLDDPEHPDRMVFDLDPDEKLDWAAVVDAAVSVRARLDDLGLVSFVKTTGGKGIHVVVPLRPRADWDEVKAFSREVAETMARDEPHRFTATVSKNARTGRIYVDYLRNGRGATAIGAYSTRARPRAPVSTPLAWDELSPAVRPNHFTVENLPARLEHLAADPWADIGKVDQVLPKPVKRKRR